jgi:hypothetical protein
MNREQKANLYQLDQAIEIAKEIKESYKERNRLLEKFTGNSVSKDEKDFYDFDLLSEDSDY